MKKLLCVLPIAILFSLIGAKSEAATLKVCTTGCTYTDVQSAVDASVAGDTILLESGKQYVTQVTLKNKSCAANNSTCYVTIKTGVSSTGTILPASTFPAANIRITPSYASVLAKLKPVSNNAPALLTDTTTIPHWWKIELIEFQANTYGGDTLIRVGSDTNATQPVSSLSPNHYVFNQIYAHGDPVSGQFRGLSFHGRDLILTNSYFEDFKSNAEGQVVWLNSAPGPFDVENNYLSGGTETFFTGGSGGSGRPSGITVVSNATTTSAVLSAVTDLAVGQSFNLNVASIEQSTEVVSIGSSTCTGSANANCVVFSPALTAAPDVPGNASWGVVLKNLTFKYNYVTRPLSWRNPIVSTPTGVNAVAASGGSLVAGNYAYRIVARHPQAVNSTARSMASAEALVTTTSTGSITISWNPVQNATVYYIYGRSPGGENIRFSVNAPTTTFTDTGGAGTTETVPTSTSVSAGVIWQVKNTFELKNMNGADIKWNVFENSWNQAQTGYIVLFTGVTASSANDSSVVRNINFQYNKVCHGAGGSQITGRDAGGQVSGRNGAITIKDNIYCDLGTQYGASVRGIIVTAGGDTTQFPKSPYDITIDHNTFDMWSGNATLYVDLYRDASYHTIENFKVTNNIFSKPNYGIWGGHDGEGQIANFLGTGGVYNKNVVAGASCSIYPVGTTCPSQSALTTLTYTNYAAGDYTVLSTSPFYNAGLDGKSYGADVSLITPGITIAITGDNSGTGSGTGGSVPPTPPPVVPLVISTGTNLPGGLVGAVYQGATIAVSGGTAPYTYSVISGALPNGFTLNASTGVIGGTPVIAGTATFTVRITDSAATPATTEKQFSIGIIEIIYPEPRPLRTNWQKRALFAETLCSDVNEQVFEGDLCYDQTEKVWKFASSTSPINTWTNLASAPSASKINGLFLSDGAAQGWSLTTTKDELLNSVSYRYLADLSGMTQCRIWMRVATATPNATATLEYSTTDSTVAFVTANVTADMNANYGQNYVWGPYGTIPAGAKTDVWLRVTGVMSTGTATPLMRNVGFNCK